MSLIPAMKAYLKHRAIYVEMRDLLAESADKNGMSTNESIVIYALSRGYTNATLIACEFDLCRTMASHTFKKLLDGGLVSKDVKRYNAQNYALTRAGKNKLKNMGLS